MEVIDEQLTPAVTQQQPSLISVTTGLDDNGNEQATPVINAMNETTTTTVSTTAAAAAIIQPDSPAAATIDGGITAVVGSSSVDVTPATTTTATTTTTDTDNNSSSGGPVLLREWQPPSPEPPTADEQQQSNMLSSPPVAPVAVVMDDDSRRSSSGGYTYPVATFVRDLVRTGMDQISSVAAATTMVAAAAAPSRQGDAQHPGLAAPPTDHHHTMPLSIRSEADAEALADAMRHYQQQQRPAGLTQAAAASAVSLPTALTSASARTMADVFDEVGENAEFILVDGDLIALPPLSENHYEQQAVGAVLQRQTELDQERKQQQRLSGCQTTTSASSSSMSHPRRMRRGVRKISKFFKRVRRGAAGTSSASNRERSATDGSTASSVAVTTAESGSCAPAVAAVSSGLSSLDESAGVAAKPPPQQPQLDSATSAEQPETETADTSPKRNKKGRRHRRSWKRREKESSLGHPQQHVHQAAPKEPPQQQQQQTDGPSSAALTGLEIPSYTLDSNNFQQPQEPHLLLPSPMDGRERRRRNQLDPLSPPLPSAADGAILPPGMTPIPEQAAAAIPPDGAYRTQSVTASFVGTTDQIATAETWDAGVVPADVAAIAFIESDDLSYWKKDDGSLIPSVLSVVPPDADYKVDKADAPDVESMLMRAAHETTVDLDSSDMPTPSLRGPRGKSDGSSDSSIVSVPLSQARHADVQQDGTTNNILVYNDMLKVVMVAAPGVDKTWIARAVRNSQKRPRKRATLGVDVHSWTPTPPPPTASSSEHGSDDNNNNGTTTTTATEPVKFMIWDVQGATGCPADSANFGAHPGTQSLFFSGQSLYLLCWDLACNNPRTNQRPLHHYDSDDDDSDDSDDDSEYLGAGGKQDPNGGGASSGRYSDNAFVREEANRRADRALRADISQRVLSWVDTIGRRCVNSAVLPVAIVPPDMSPAEAKRRCTMLQQALVEHHNNNSRQQQQQQHEGSGDDFALPMLLSGGNDEILCVNYGTGEGIDQLQETIQAIGADASRSVFHHVGTPVPPGTVEVLDLIRHFKEQHKLILLDHLLGAIGESMQVDQVLKALEFLSNIGEILYYTSDDDVLSRYIVLSRKWLVSALSCILRNDLKRELSEARRFMNMQCIYSDDKFTESQIIRTLVSGTMSSCPLLSDNDSRMLWQQMSFMRDAVDSYSQLSESSTSTPTMFYFLERLLVHTGIFLPLECSDAMSLERSNVFFVPSLLAQADPRDVWSYKSSESWMTALCHSWLFRDGAPSNLMERLTVKVLSDLYTFAQQFQGGGDDGDLSIPERSRTVPLRLSSMNEFIEDHNSEALGRVKIHQIVCWKSSLLVKIGTVFADHDSGNLRESFVEVFVAIVDQSSPHCVASDAMRASMQRVVVSGKGQVGHHGRKIWKGGYQVILKSVRDLLSNYSNVDSQVICPECLAHSESRSASTWSWDSVNALAQSGEPVVRCMRGHGVDSNLVVGTCAERKPAPVTDPSLTHVGTTKHVSEILPSVVVVGLWDPNTKVIRSVGSGFVVDKKLGLIVTAGHVLFNMEGGRTNFGTPYFGIPDAKVVIGVIPDGSGHTAKWRYMAEIVVDDIQYVDACVVRIKTRMEQDVDDEGPGCANQSERILPLDSMPDEKLRALKTTTRFELEERVRVLGYNQGGEGVYEKGRHVNRSADFASGYICRRFQNPTPDDSSSSDSSSHMSFSPREEVVIMCPTIAGHSGGPCVNNDGKVIGILSRADPVDRQRCYLVPASELKPLITKAKKLSNWRSESIY